MTTVIGATCAETVLLSCVEHAVCCHKSALQLPSKTWSGTSAAGLDS